MSALDAIAKGNWKRGPFGCLGDGTDKDDISACCLGYCFPCLTYAAAQTKLDGNFITGCAYFCCCPCCALFTQRKVIEAKTGADGSDIFDVAIVCCCSLCALLQQAHQVELKVTSYDWSQATKPPTAQTMKAEAEAAKEAVIAKK